MALSAAILKSELLKLYDETDPGFVGYATDVATAATNLGNAYDTYAADAVDLIGGTSNLRMKADFISYLSSNIVPAGTLAVSLAALDTACVNYWTLATFNPGIPVAPMIIEVASVISAIVPGTVVTSMTALLSAMSNDVDTLCGDIATALHTFTTTCVTVTTTGTDILGNPVPPVVGLIS